MHVFHAISWAAFFTGCFFYFAGRMKLGTLVKLLPPAVISGLLASIGLLAIRGGLAHASRVPFQYLWPIHWVPGFFSPCAAVSSAVAVEGVYSLSD